VVIRPHITLTETCLFSRHAKIRKGSDGTTEIAGLDRVARVKKQGLKTQEWRSRHEKAGVDIVRVDNVARRNRSGQRGSG